MRQCKAVAGRPYKDYPSNLSDDEYAHIAEILPSRRQKGSGRQCETDLRAVVDAFLYRLTQGCSWRALPGDFPPWSTVYNYFSAWKSNGLLDHLCDRLRAMVRTAEGKEVNPQAVAVDSQSVKATAYADAGTSGVDGGKKVKGRKRHLIVDSLGLLVAVLVTAANVPDARAGFELASKFPESKRTRLLEVHADSSYEDLGFAERLAELWNVRVVISGNPNGGFTPIKFRWRVERSFAWLGRCRLMSRDYERTTESSEAWCKLAFCRLCLRRLTRRKF